MSFELKDRELPFIPLFVWDLRAKSNSHSVSDNWGLFKYSWISSFYFVHFRMPLLNILEAFEISQFYLYLLIYPSELDSWDQRQVDIWDQFSRNKFSVQLCRPVPVTAKWLHTQLNNSCAQYMEVGGHRKPLFNLVSYIVYTKHCQGTFKILTSH